MSHLYLRSGAIVSTNLQPFICITIRDCHVAAQSGAPRNDGHKQKNLPSTNGTRGNKHLAVPPTLIILSEGQSTLS